MVITRLNVSFLIQSLSMFPQRQHATADGPVSYCAQERGRRKAKADAADFLAVHCRSLATSVADQTVDADLDLIVISILR